MPPSSRRPRHVVTRQRELEAKAHHLRQHPTVSEQRLWSALRDSRLGLPFRRQVLISRYIADFVCPKARLVVVLMPPLAPAAGAVSPRSVLARRAAGSTLPGGTVMQRRVVLRADGGDEVTAVRPCSERAGFSSLRFVLVDGLSVPKSRRARVPPARASRAVQRADRKAARDAGRGEARHES